MNEIMNEQVLVNISIVSMDLFLHSPEPNRLLLHSPDMASLGNILSFLLFQFMRHKADSSCLMALILQRPYLIRGPIVAPFLPVTLSS